MPVCSADAHVCPASGLKVGELVHVIADAHIYDRHIPMVEELLKKEPLLGPTLWVDPEIKDFYQLQLTASNWKIISIIHLITRFP